MTTEDTEETRGHQTEALSSNNTGGNTELRRSFTTLSTIAVQAGKSQVVVSVLQSGSVVHLQLVQVQPGLCEIGWNQEENQTLVQEELQLLEKLEKHEPEVLGAVKEKRGQEEEEDLSDAMEASLSEGWSLLLHLLRRRLEVLTLTSDFYCQTAEFAASINRFEDLQMNLEEDRLTEVQLSYGSMRRDLLRKSLQVLTSSRSLLQKLGQLQRAEALQRTGGELQAEEAWEEGSQCSRGPAVRLEEMVERLQDRRQRADQTVRSQLQQMENRIKVRKTETESNRTNWDDWSPLDQNIHSGSRSHQSGAMRSVGKSEGCTTAESGPHSDLQTEFRTDQKCLSQSEVTGDPDLETGSRSEDAVKLQSRLKPDVQPGSGLNLNLKSRPDQSKNLEPESRSDETEIQQSGFKSFGSMDLQHGSGSNLVIESPSEEDRTFGLGSGSDLKLWSASGETRLGSGQTKDLYLECESEELPRSISEKTTDLQSESTSTETRSVQPSSSLNLQADPRLDAGFRSDPMIRCSSGALPGSGSDTKSASRSEESEDLRPGSGKQQVGSRPVDTTDFQSGFRSVLKPTSRIDTKPQSRTEETGSQQSGSSSEADDMSSKKDDECHPSAAAASSGQVTVLQGTLGDDTPHAEDPTQNILLTNERQQLLLTFECLEKKVCSWLQRSRGALSNSCEAGRQLSEAEHTLNTHLQLQAQAQLTGDDVENLRQILDQLRALQRPTSSSSSPQAASGPSRTSPQPGPSRRLSPLKALTEQLKRGSAGTQARTANAMLHPLPDLADRVDAAMKELQSLSRKMDSNLQLLQRYVPFLRTAGEMEGLMEVYRCGPEVGAETGKEAGRTREETCWEEMLQKLLAIEELGNSCIHTVTTVSESGLDLESILTTVQQTMQRLNKTRQEAEELRTRDQTQVQQQQDVILRRKHQDRLIKTLQDLNSVSELLESSTLMDLGSDLQTSKLQEHFRQAGPCFSQLNAEVEYMVKSWEGLRGVQDQLEGGAAMEEDLSELLRLQKMVRDKIEQSQSILDLTGSFHLKAKQLEKLLQSEPTSPPTGPTGFCGSNETKVDHHREAQQQIQNLLKTTSALKTNICAAVAHSSWAGFRLGELEARLQTLDSLCASWLKEAARHEERLRREQLARLLQDDIRQICDSFKELKKRFSNTKFNYLKRNDRTRNMKAVRNQLQQVELYEEKLQVLRKRLHGVTSRLGSEVKDGGVARQVEDAANELQRQMGEFERSMSEHRKTLDMTCRLQQAMDEYQFWCEEAGATIARVGKFSSQCRSTEAVSVLYRQFEKFVWPTVPQQEERISQITELAIRIHGAEEGRRYIEKMVGKHSQMVRSIRELSDGLMELEAKLKLESLKQRENEVEESGQRKDNETQEKERKEGRNIEESEQRDNCSTLEIADMCELKETGHTPELTVINGKSPLQKSPSENRDRQTLLSDCSSSQDEMVTSSSSPSEENQPVQILHGQSKPVTAQPQATPLPPVIGPALSNIQQEFKNKEMEEMGEKAASTSCGSNMMPLQDASVDLQQQEAMPEDSLSNDEYDCASPDDISLPPLADTPESAMFQSDVEESVCFSSHSVHMSQYGNAQPEQAAAGAIQQQRASSRTHSCPSPSISLLSSTRFRLESFVQSVVTLPAPRLFTSSLCTILKTRETSPESAGLSLESTEHSLPRGSNTVPNSFTRKSVHERTPSQTSQHVTTPRVAEPSQTGCPRLSTAPNPDCHSRQSDACLAPSLLGVERDLHQVADPVKHTRQTTQDEDGRTRISTSPTTQQNIYLLSSSSVSHLSVQQTHPQVDPVPGAKGFSQTSNLNTYPQDTDPPKPYTTVSQTPTDSQHIPLLQSSTGCGKVLDQEEPKTDSDGSGGSSFTTATTVTQQTVCRRSCMADGPQPDSSFNQDTGEPAEGHGPPQSNHVSFTREESHAAASSLHGSLTSICDQQSVHGSSMSPSRPAQPATPPQPDGQTKVLAEQANPHVPPSPSPPHLLTPQQDPDICLPVTIREEIRLTPQIQGPPIPPPFTLAESLPQGKASRHAPPCFTRPLSRATVMEGSPVTLEVEVMGPQEPTLTWFKDGEVAPTCDREKGFPFFTEAVESAGGLNTTQQTALRKAQQEVGGSGDEDRWLVTEVYDIIGVDWLTWFGTLCFLLWLLYLIVL
ncbi:coiled-coil domain-containing protein 141 [Cololabis saira]|uniref:coiled-coil domain-containing protein 141 n=1 Tax=Cololabis saira TaxID=129043 RepID=UPI002AD53370|nr:coiled-coil domain-containing protein 141 [Cololabis saira]